MAFPGTLADGNLAGDSPYDAALAALDAFGLAAEQNEQAAEALEAQLTIHGFHRDPRLTDQIGALLQAVGRARAHAASARRILVSHHASGSEYHRSGADAGATAFRADGRSALPDAGPAPDAGSAGIPSGRTEPVDPVDAILGTGPDALPATLATRQVLRLAVDAGLKPELRSGTYRGSYRVIVDSGGRRDCLFGGIDIGAGTGRILRAYLTHGHWGEERRYDHVADIRAVLKSWLALNGLAVRYRARSQPPVLSP